MAYRRAPVSPSGESPCQLMLNRKIRTRIDILSITAESQELKDSHLAERTPV